MILRLAVLGKGNRHGSNLQKLTFDVNLCDNSFIWRCGLNFSERLEAVAGIFGDRKRVKCRIGGLKLDHSYNDVVEIEYRVMDEGYRLFSFAILGDGNFPMQTIGAVLSENGEWEGFSHSAHPISTEDIQIRSGSGHASKTACLDLIDDVIWKSSRAKGYLITDIKIGQIER